MNPTETTTGVLPTHPEPDNAAPRGTAGRLHLMAETVLLGWEQKPDPWYPEFCEWRESIIGERPRKEGGKRGYENWNLVSLGMVMAWGYFAAQLAEDPGDPEDIVVPPAPVMEKGDAPSQLVLPGVGTYSILGPDGQAVIEGKR